MTTVQLQGLEAARNKQLRAEREMHFALLREMINADHKETTYTYRGVAYTK